MNNSLQTVSKKEVSALKRFSSNGKKIPGVHQVQPSKENQEVIKPESKNKVKYSCVNQLFSRKGERYLVLVPEV